MSRQPDIFSPDPTFITFKDAPELSTLRRQSSETDLSVEKTLLVNPKCPVRIMLEYIRKKCALGKFTEFDLCDESGALKGLFSLPTFVYATEQFEHKRNYYVVVIKQENDRRVSVLPQLNRENRIYEDLKNRIKRFLATGDVSPMVTPPVVATPAKAAATTGKPGKKK